jgi:hypothetical protein
MAIVFPESTRRTEQLVRSLPEAVTEGKALSIHAVHWSACGTWPTLFGAAMRLSLIWGLPDAPEGFIGAARGDRI